MWRAHRLATITEKSLVSERACVCVREVWLIIGTEPACIACPQSFHSPAPRRTQISVLTSNRSTLRLRQSSAVAVCSRLREGSSLYRRPMRLIWRHWSRQESRYNWSSAVGLHSACFSSLLCFLFRAEHKSTLLPAALSPRDVTWPAARCKFLARAAHAVQLPHYKDVRFLTRLCSARTIILTSSYFRASRNSTSHSAERR